MKIKQLFLSFAVLIFGLSLLACSDSKPPKKKLKIPRLFLLSGVADTGKEPSFLVSDDFNNDSNLDLLVANSAEHTLSYLKGNGDGSFKEGIKLKAGADPICIAVADFNNDKLPDFAELNYQDQTIHVFINTGNSFRDTGEILKPGKIPINLTAADFNGDGLTDLVVSLRFHKVAFLWGKGNGLFSEPEHHPVKGQPTGIISGDYDNDGILDMAVALAGTGKTGIQLFWGKGGGKFLPSNLFRGGRQPLTIINLDANNDGYMDLLTSSNSFHAITMILNNKDRTFKALEDFSAGEFPKFVASYDFTGDNIPDLAISNATNDTISVLLGFGDGTFTYPAKEHRVEEYPQGIVVGDFNKDGKMDIAVSCRDKNMINVLTKRNLPQGFSIYQPEPEPEAEPS
ncbi:MAG: VCBS repeat-containing protein [Candidatus Nitronauta litoralis]|uniref:VCBS repeat-containing protein n=1 Tax=Candidatus Nitronauta litoralis TaxID=2705533 RepID=A0A7T0BT36_9BACT|nr:MAG: VCBS repeat-containing protein [Candidatus Nitronauta litoralis]